MVSFVVVMPVANDEKVEDVERMLNHARNVVCVVDQDFPDEKYERLVGLGVDVIRIRGFGVGKGLHYAFKFVLDCLSPDWIIRIDPHVKLLSDFQKLLKNDRFVCSGIHLTPEGGASKGLMIDLFTWNYVWNESSRIIIMSDDCTLAFPHHIVSEYIDEMWKLPYISKSNIDTTLTLTRFGYPVLITDFHVIHYYNKQYPKERIENRDISEEWISELCCESPYYMGCFINDVLFAKRHYLMPELFPFWSKIPSKAKFIVEKYFKSDAKYLDAPLGITDLIF